LGFRNSDAISMRSRCDLSERPSDWSARVLSLARARQVEHPVTEMVSGIDLVEWQLRVAAGEPLPLTQPQLTLSGHAFEARVYAERPEAGFLPGSGTVYHLRTPAIMGDTYVGPATRASAAGHAVRLDTAIVEGDEVSVFYDPMIAKLIVRGADRSSALQLLRRALGQWEIVGLPTNVPFLRRVLDTDAFANAEVHTAFIEQHKAVLLPKAPPPPSAAMLQLAALHWAQASADTLNTVLPASSAWGGHSFTRLGGAMGGGGSAAPITLQPLDFDGVPTGDAMHAYLRRTAAAPLGSAALGAFALALAPAPPPAAAKGAKSAAGTPPAPPASLEWVEAAIVEWCSPTREFRAFVDGASVRGCAVTRLVSADDAAGRPGMAIDLFVGEQRASVLVQDAAQMAQLVLSSADATAARQAAVHSPMPGKIVRVLVVQGQAVRAGEPLVVLEAMKMEHTLKAPTDVVIGGVHAAEGQVVAQRALLLSFQQEGTASAT
jgi:3-methylcrotonyl-CoA carboxylase alpha subunit